MGNVISAQYDSKRVTREKRSGITPSNWNNGTLLGKKIEEILIKNNTVLQKRACCMGLTQGQPNADSDNNYGLEVPIANIGIGPAKDWGLKNYTGAEWRAHHGEDMSANDNPYENEYVVSQSKGKHYEVNPDADVKTLLSRGMVTKNLEFHSGNVPTCTFDTEIDMFTENETSSTKEYRGYDSATNYVEGGDSKELRTTCDNLMTKYAMHSIKERNCITTCGDIKSLSSQELETSGFGPICKDPNGGMFEDSKQIIDVRNAGCNASTTHALGQDPVAFHAAFNYPNEAACLLSSAGRAYNDERKLGNLFKRGKELQNNVHMIDPYCTVKKLYQPQKNMAYYDFQMLTTGINCLQTIDVRNVQINAGRDSTMSYEQSADCPSTSKQENVTGVTPADAVSPPTGGDDESTGSEDPESGGSGQSGGSQGSGGSGGSRGSGEQNTNNAQNGGSEERNSDNSRNPPSSKREKKKDEYKTLGLAVDDRIVYGVGAALGILMIV